MLSLHGFAAVISAWITATVMSLVIFLVITSAFLGVHAIPAALVGALGSAFFCSVLAVTLQYIGAKAWQAGIVVGVSLAVSIISASSEVFRGGLLERIEIFAVFGAICIFDGIAASYVYKGVRRLLR